MIFLQSVSFNPSIVYNVLGIIVIVVTGLGFFFKLRNKIDLVENKLENAIESTKKLELKTAADYSKIESKMSELETRAEDRHRDLQNRIDKMPLEIINLLKKTE